jgi:hypothetical protein
MSNAGLARRTEIAVKIDGVDVSADMNKYLISMSYTDNEEDKTDDLQISLDDREGIWLTDWLTADEKGATVSAVILQKNWESDGKDRVLECGEFSIDSLDGSGSPATTAIKATCTGCSGCTGGCGMSCQGNCGESCSGCTGCNNNCNGCTGASPIQSFAVRRYILVEILLPANQKAAQLRQAHPFICLSDKILHGILPFLFPNHTALLWKRERPKSWRRESL